MKHSNGARAMARHVAEGGNPYDDFGKHIIGSSRRTIPLRKSQNLHESAPSVMAESLAGYLDVVNERIEVQENGTCVTASVSIIKKIRELQTTQLEEVPEDVPNSWIDELTIYKQFNEEPKGPSPTFTNL